ncbi:MAG TPA: sulfite exporter TauE/SafE family protein [Pyrinomonadaceae bacterium]|nr:sulfite exporter TauE/SafE family protein [Pyrinomonadaceae bacterium]
MACASLARVNLWQEAVIAAAAFAAGLINSIAGGGTLVSFPALLWTGRDPVLANATSTVALWPASLAGAYGFRRELKGGARTLLLFGVPSLVGGVLGAWLLLRTPSETFGRLVPFLILFATLLLTVQEPISRRLRGAADEQKPPTRAWWAGAFVFQFFVGVYGGYFGAGIGILMLAALGLLGFTDIHRMNALKNLLAICINGVAAAIFITSGAVIWSDVFVMTFAAIAGGYAGARLAYKLGRRFVRLFVIITGLVMSVSLFFR